MLEQSGKFNDLSPKLREEIEKKIAALGKKARFRFNISNPNPDPEKRGGERLYPFAWTLDPITFDIIDPYEDRKDKQKKKTIGITVGVSEDGRQLFERVRVFEREKGVKSFDLENIDEVDMVAYLLLHPKLSEGMFADKNKSQLITLIDEKKAATEAKIERSARVKALNAAQAMSDAEIVALADAMGWDSGEDIGILRNDAEDLAENSPDTFNDLIKGKDIEVQAAVKRGIDAKVISIDSNRKLLWLSNNQVVCQLSLSDGKTDIQCASEWIQTAGNKGDEFYKKLTSLIK